MSIPEENIHLDDYGDGTKPKNSRGKFFAVFVGIIAVVVAGFTVFRWYEIQKGRKGVENLANSLRQAEEKVYQKQLADIYGGKTPQETLSMYIDAVEKGDYELASRYFVVDRQEKWKSELLEIKKVDKIEQFLGPIRSVSKSIGEYSENGNTYSIHNPILVSFVKYPSGVWKIIEI